MDYVLGEQLNSHNDWIKRDGLIDYDNLPEHEIAGGIESDIKHFDNNQRIGWKFEISLKNLHYHDMVLYPPFWVLEHSTCLMKFVSTCSKNHKLKSMNLRVSFQFFKMFCNLFPDHPWT